MVEQKETLREREIKRKQKLLKKLTVSQKLQLDDKEKDLDFFSKNCGGYISRNLKEFGNCLVSSQIVGNDVSTFKTDVEKTLGVKVEVKAAQEKSVDKTLGFNPCYIITLENLEEHFDVKSPTLKDYKEMEMLIDISQKLKDNEKHGFIFSQEIFGEDIDTFKKGIEDVSDLKVSVRRLNNEPFYIIILDKNNNQETFERIEDILDISQELKRSGTFTSTQNLDEKFKDDLEYVLGGKRVYMESKDKDTLFPYTCITVKSPKKSSKKKEVQLDEKNQVEASPR